MKKYLGFTQVHAEHTYIYVDGMFVCEQAIKVTFNNKNK